MSLRRLLNRLCLVYYRDMDHFILTVYTGGLISHGLAEVSCRERQCLNFDHVNTLTRSTLNSVHCQLSARATRLRDSTKLKIIIDSNMCKLVYKRKHTYAL